MPTVRGLDELTEFQGEGDLALLPSEVMRCKKHFSEVMRCQKHFDTLVTTPIESAPNTCS